MSVLPEPKSTRRPNFKKKSNFLLILILLQLIDFFLRYVRCLEIHENPYSGVVNWDNFGYAIIQAFWCITLEAWSPQMYMVQNSLTPYVWPYYYLLTLLVSFFSLNLCLAVIENEYSDKKESSEVSCLLLRL